jgi:hypothetical protein
MSPFAYATTRIYSNVIAYVTWDRQSLKDYLCLLLSLAQKKWRYLYTAGFEDIAAAFLRIRVYWDMKP